jgi:hypothetical protein
MQNAECRMQNAGWSPFRWVLWVAAIFTGQLLIIYVIGERGLHLVPQAPFATSISLQPDLSSPELPDPALLALPSSSGFSGEAWLKYSSQQYHLTELPQLPGWLALTNHLQTLGASIAQFAAEARPPVLRIADQALPESALAEPAISPLPLPSRSRLELEGVIVEAPPPALPSWQSSEMLGQSVVWLAFDRTGKPFSSVLLASSGLKQADDYALRLTTTLRFRPAVSSRYNAASDQLIFGKLIFHWRTAPVSTRGVTSLPPAP